MAKGVEKEFGMDRRGRIGLLLAVVIFVLFSFGVFQKLNGEIKDAVYTDAVQHMENTGRMNADVICRELVNRRVLLESIAANLSAPSADKVDFMLKKMQVYADNFNFYNMGILTKDGIIRTINGLEIDVSGNAVFEKALQGESIISVSQEASDGSKIQINVLAVPVYKGNEVEVVLVGTYRSSDLAEALNFSALDGKGYSFVLDSDGSAVIHPEEGNTEEYLDLLDYVNNTEELSPHGEQKKSFAFSYRGEPYIGYFSTIGINDWYLLNCVKERDAFAGTRVILHNVYVGMAFLWAVVIFVLGLLIMMTLRYQRRVQKIVFEDDLLEEENYDYLKMYFPQITQEEQRKMALFVLDVDKFKEYNYIYGSKGGDQLLKYINTKFHQVLPEDHLYRYNADQFVGLYHCSSEEKAQMKTEKFIAAVEKDIQEKNVHPFVLSVGICMLTGSDMLQVVYSDALIAKNTIKGNQVVKYAFYDEKMRKERLEFMEMESQFQDAIKNEEFKVYYQPKYDMRNGEIIGAEALVRWIKPDGTMISPGEFIPCFEANGQIVELDEAVMRAVCRQMQEMEDDGLETCQVSVNLSRVHLKYPGIVGEIGRMMKEMQIDPAKIAIEITESAIYEDSIPMQIIVSDLHKLGCQVNMDDYGTGISSLSSLANVEFDVLKLDKSFIDEIGNEKMESVIRSTINLAAELGMTLIAEGVEEQRQVDALTEWGCWFAQGFFYSRPVPEEEYRKLLKKKSV